MHFDIRLRTLLHEETNASCLITRKILVNDASTRQYQRKLFVRNFVRRLVFDRMKLRFTVGMIEAILKQSWRARMILGRARPEDTVILFDLLPCYAVVIGFAAT